MSDSSPATRKRLGAWCCPHCANHRTKTLNGINLHLYRKHGGDGFGIYRTAWELEAQKADRRRK